MPLATVPGMTSQYFSEVFTSEEQHALQPYVSNLDGPVFALNNLPQITCAALFARYSRSPKSLRRLLLDEFLEAQPSDGHGQAGAGAKRAGELFSRVLAEFGDDSVAQLGGVHIACEQVSQPLAKALEWGRLAAYLEQSTRYIPYTDKRDGFFRYYRDPEVMQSRYAESYVNALDGLFSTYCVILEPLQEHLDAKTPELGDAAARKRAIRALALDVARALLPAGTVSNVGIFASGQSYEQMVMRLRAHPLPEAQSYAELINTELQKVIPDFISRLDRPDRGGRWVEYLRDLRTSTEKHALRDPGDAQESVRLLDWDKNAESTIMSAALFDQSTVDLQAIERHVDARSEAEKDDLWNDIVGDRGNRRHRPGRGFEHTAYTFEITSDYGAFRDLQRHRMLTIQWQTLNTDLGYAIPEAIVEAGLEARWRPAIERAESVRAELIAEFPQQAQYLVTLGHRIRYVMRLNVREAMQMLELRTSPQAHPNYRTVCRELHRQIKDVAGHRRIADSMQFVGKDDVHLPLYASEAAKAGAAS
jgi:thymidylate synthase ThyX